ncbi:MAG: DUF86 domain-containing protein [Deltaproteobacteria bacterium]|nr:DUF86 domain-containing protein [Deltaproteobacteria bacterium]
MEPPVNGILARKLALMDDYLRRLEGLPLPSFPQFCDDFFLRKAVERVLQVLVEGMVDVAERWIALQGEPPPVTSGDAVARLAEAGVISHGEVCQRMVKFRNFIVHHYASIDESILYDVLVNHLGDLRRFVEEVQRYVGRAG